MKDKTIYVPFTEKNPTTAGELKGNVQAAETAEVSVVSGEKTLKDQENIADAMTMRITAEDGKTNDYTIKQKIHITGRWIMQDRSREMYGLVRRKRHQESGRR